MTSAKEPDSPYPFNPEQIEKLKVYKAAVKVGFYSDELSDPRGSLRLTAPSQHSGRPPGRNFPYPEQRN